MKKQTLFTAMILMLVTQTGITENAKNFTPSHITKQINVINESDLYIVPTGEGYSQGCIGGSIPAILDPIKPHASRMIDVVFINYLPSCQFDVLPIPNVISYVQACRGVQADNTIVFTGDKFASMRCRIVQ